MTKYFKAIPSASSPFRFVGKVLVLVAFLVSANPCEGFKGVLWKECRLAAWSTSMEYPDVFPIENLWESGQSADLEAPDLGIKVVFYGGEVHRGTLMGEFEASLGAMAGQQGRVVRQILENDWFELQGAFQDGRNFYLRTIVQDGIAAHLYVEYPSDEALRLEGVCRRMGESMRID